jgi:sugar phosphate isomerase/epimerase
VPPPLGLDVFSLRSQGLSAIQILELCVARGIGVVHFSEPRLLGAAGAAALRDVRICAQELGIALEVGMLSIASGATVFNAAAGSGEAQLAQTIDLATALGSPIVRCVVGTFRDRAQPGGIEGRVAEALAAIAAVRPRALDAGVKIAVENHAGDLQSRELKALVEDAGTDLVGVCLDAGNAFWAIEDPHAALETLAPYILTSHTRDTAVQATENGAEVAWTRMGEGNVGIEAYLDRFQTLRPGKPVMLEVIVMPAPRLLPYRDPQFRAGYPRMTDEDFQRFADRIEHAPPVALPSGAVDPAAELANVEASIRWTEEYLRRR